MKKLICLIAAVLALCSCSRLSDLDGIGASKDNTPPVLGLTSLTNGQEVGGTYTLSGSVSDGASGVKAVYVSLDVGSKSVL